MGIDWTRGGEGSAVGGAGAFLRDFSSSLLLRIARNWSFGDEIVLVEGMCLRVGVIWSKWEAGAGFEGEKTELDMGWAGFRGDVGYESTRSSKFGRGNGVGGAIEMH